MRSATLPGMNRRLSLAFALLKFVSGYFLTSPQYDLHRDEYLYLNHGRHLAWGYLEVPPLSAAQGWLSLALGGGAGWVRFWPFLWGAATLYLVMRLAQRLGGGWFAAALAGTCYLGTAFARLNLLFQPNSFEVFSFVFCLYWLVRYVQNERPRFLYLLGLGLGLGLLNKYTTLFFIAALGGALLLTPARRLLLNRHFWGAAGLALLLWAPNLAWQIGHGIPFRHHMQLLHDTQLVHVDAAEFWKLQLLMCVAAVWVWVPGLLALFFSPRLRPYRAVGWVAVLGVAIQAVLHGKAYYTLGYYPVLFSFGAWWWAARLAGLRRLRVAAALRPVLVALPLLLLAPLVPFIFPVRPPAAMLGLRARYAGLGFYTWEDGREHALPQDYADMRGWRELADKTWAAYRQLPDSVRAHTLIKCANYGQASAINYYNRHRALPPAQSFNGSFLYWFPVRQDWQAALIIDDEPHPELAAQFASYREVEAVTDAYARERGTRIMLGLRPAPALVVRVNNEWRDELAQWETPAH
ncbi:glycosyltransferase family 39 protein [Hymenobacter sp. DH14]|uniref:Glycosyltransferase family 39 protein n=1 Tax=Hymenobacter cyanobacteriorum TaxID=2926463 RepID=A0A9X1VE53_9BACT|nr:glycosyltransferase family 39 protein [Hymenobacter cyanobacteriorum]MCI1186870.1 glycosyltransferase family 39 protein [Hymenobacter cyanobacteriorum]